VARQPVLQFLAVEPAERDGGQFDLEAATMPQKAIEKYLAGVAQAHAFWHFIGALTSTSPQKRAMIRGVWPWRWSQGKKGGSSASDAKRKQARPHAIRAFSPQVRKCSPAKTPPQVQRRGQRISLEDTRLAVGRHEVETFLRLRKVGDADSPAKVGRLVQQPMLTCWQTSMSCPVVASWNELARPPGRGRAS